MFVFLNHRIDTNVLKTRSQMRPAMPKINSGSILTPTHKGQRQRIQDDPRLPGIRTQNQRPLPDNFYTNSEIFPMFNNKPDSTDRIGSQQVASANAKQDLGVGPPEVEPKTTSFRETAIIALKLSQSIMNLYKTVSPYFIE